MSGEKCLVKCRIIQRAPRNIMLHEIDKTEFAAMVTDGAVWGRVFSYIQADSALARLTACLIWYQQRRFGGV